jgi:hypothetical protein
MNLFELNARLAVKLGQSLETLYDLDYFEYSMYFNIVKKDIEDASQKPDDLFKEVKVDPNIPLKVNLPDNIRLK